MVLYRRIHTTTRLFTRKFGKPRNDAAIVSKQWNLHNYNCTTSSFPPSSVYCCHLSNYSQKTFCISHYPRTAATQLRAFATSQGISRTEGMLGAPTMFIISYDRPLWQPLVEDEHEIIPRDEFGVPASIPPEVSTEIKHVYYVPPQFYPFLKKLGDDTPALRPYMQKLVTGQLTYNDYEEMFYKFAKPLKIYRRQIAMPYRSTEEKSREEEVGWESAWLSFRQRVLADFRTQMYSREYLVGMLIGIYFAWLWIDQHRQYRVDMKLFYLEAPEHKINWVKPRGDLV